MTNLIRRIAILKFRCYKEKSVRKFCSVRAGTSKKSAVTVCLLKYDGATAERQRKRNGGNKALLCSDSFLPIILKKQLHMRVALFCPHRSSRVATERLDQRNASRALCAVLAVAVNNSDNWLPSYGVCRPSVLQVLLFRTDFVDTAERIFTKL